MLRNEGAQAEARMLWKVIHYLAAHDRQTTVRAIAASIGATPEKVAECVRLVAGQSSAIGLDSPVNRSLFGMR